ncbi:MAG: hypothetical protein ACJ73D_07155 [Pyrinomonadaceae bacterium]
MKRLIVILIMLAGTVAAQDSKITRKDIVDTMEDADSFGKTVNFLGVLRGGSVILDQTCVFTPEDQVQPEDRCEKILDTSALLVYDERNLGSITLPGNTFKTNMYMIPSHFINYEFFNDTGVQVNNARFGYTPYITIESPALNDPRAVDPITNAPLAGKLDINLSAARNITRSLAIGEFVNDGFTYSRAFIAGITKPGLVGMGVPLDVSDKMFRQPMTIRMNIRGRVRHIDFAQVFYAIRIMGN